MAAEELGILGGIGEGHCSGDEWVAGKGLSAGRLPEGHTSGAKAHGHFGAVFGTTEVMPCYKAGNATAGPSTPLKYASLRMTARLLV
jgi:hypothetical protein